LYVSVENKWANIDVIYYEYGALVLVYNNSERATRSFNILQDAMFDSKPLLVLLLPNIQVGQRCICHCSMSPISLQSVTRNCFTTVGAGYSVLAGTRC